MIFNPAFLALGLLIISVEVLRSTSEISPRLNVPEMSPSYEMRRKNVLDTSTGKGSTQLSKKDNESKSFNFRIESWPGKSEKGLEYTRKQTLWDKRNFTVFFAVYKDTTPGDLKSVSSSKGRNFTEIDPFNNRHPHDEKQEGISWRVRLKPRGLSLPAAVHRFLFLATGSFFLPTSSTLLQSILVEKMINCLIFQVFLSSSGSLGQTQSAALGIYTLSR